MVLDSPLFSDEDRKLIEASNYDPDSKPNFNPLSALLFWDDESPFGISLAGSRVLYTLLMARALMYYDRKLPSDMFDPQYFKSVWDQALASGIRWTGFNRLKLSDEDRQYYLTELQRDRPEGV